ncbi:hypothetical protein IU449_00560 [Nocardia higoensis]|uniref:Uncharacterized protein n=1 Tax=Nocardia higoensis TaxID=228599 RepID=A0ABS0D8F4_9NOCA|nr:hypothetical protein [Nocardia higoensis]MBF6353053.1 hypothetical protein [Nocardia higoensis]
MGRLLRREHTLPAAALVDLRRPIPLIRWDFEDPTIRMNRVPSSRIR